MTLRRMAASVALLALAVTVILNAIVTSWSARDPAAASRWWPSHPDVRLSFVEFALGRASAAGQAPDEAVFQQLALIAKQSPMATAPLLANGVAALQAGDEKRAGRLFAIAGRRQPRELAPHYFLADLHLRNGRVEEGLRELVNLARLAPGGIAGAAPFVAQYARAPANWPLISAAFERQPELAGPVLQALARDPANSAALLVLARGEQRKLDAPWIKTAIDAHVEQGRFAEGRALWARLSDVRDNPPSLVFDAAFRDPGPPPPFNWSLAQSAVGTAERQSGGGLQVLLYGSQSGPIARQLLVLRPGRYRFSSAARGTLADPQSLAWNLSCANEKRPLIDTPVAASGRVAVDFTIPSGCTAQWLSLDARAQDIRGDGDLRIAYAKVERLGA